jgi:TonB family protein
MTKFRHYRHTLFLLTLAWVCAGGKISAQESLSGSNALPIIIDRKQATALVLVRPDPEYPPVAKVNYIQGQVQLELTVDGKGKVASAHVLEGNALLAASALKAAARWLYHPLATPSGPSGFITTVKLKFTLVHRGPELTPRQAERDFLRQVKLPQMIRPPGETHPGDTVHMRVLVNEQGLVVDTDVSPMGREKLEAARESLRRWTFRPAHWGSLPIASYLDVDVPVSAPSLARAAPNSGSR